MNLDRLEYEVRLLPHVVACAITDAQVSVLLDPRGDPDTVAVAVAGILITAGLDRPVRVMGGTPGVAALPHRRFAAPVAVGSGIGVGVLALATAVAALAGAPPFSAPTHPEAKAPVATAEAAANGPDLLHLAVRPRSNGRPTLPAASPPVGSLAAVQAPTVVALPGDVVSGALVVAAGPGRAQGHAGAPGRQSAVVSPVSPIPSPAAAPVAIPVVTPKPKRTDPVVVVPPDAGAPPQRPIVVPSHVGHHDDADEGDDVDHADPPSAPTAPRSVTHEVRVNVERLVGKLRAQVLQAYRHGHD
ncbi:MAG: hypothetical protein JWO37_4022 [Acidimicrobiales bacterium]|nr:hypothetical protein [Acidimicrobiales bacterium]